MEGLSKEVKTQKAIGVVKPLVLMQKGEFREGHKRNWTVSLETGALMVADAVQRFQRAEASTRQTQGLLLLLLLLSVSAGGRGAGSRIQTNCMGSDQLCWDIAG